MKVSRLSYTELWIARFAGRVCTATEHACDEPKLFIEKLIRAGHESVLEHLNYTFFIEGITRGLLQEVARHRHVSLSVQSTRWALKRTLPKQIEEISQGLVSTLFLGDQYLLENAQLDILQLIEKALNSGESIDKVKKYLPESFKTSLVLTTNARELRHIFKLRTAPNAYREFRELCHNMHDVLPQDHLFMFSDCIYSSEGAENGKECNG